MVPRVFYVELFRWNVVVIILDPILWTTSIQRMITVSSPNAVPILIAENLFLFVIIACHHDLPRRSAHIMKRTSCFMRVVISTHQGAVTTRLVLVHNCIRRL